MKSRGQPTTYKCNLTHTHTHTHTPKKKKKGKEKRMNRKKTAVSVFKKNPFVITNETFPIS